MTAIDHLSGAVDRGDLAGAGLLAVIAFFAVHRYLVLRRQEAANAGGPPAVGAAEKLFFLIGGLAPLLMFGALRIGLGAARGDHPALADADAWFAYSTSLYALTGLVSIQQLYVVKVLRFDWNPVSLRIAWIALAALPLALILGMGALTKIFIGGVAPVPDMLSAGIAFLSVIGIALWLAFALIRNDIGERYRATVAPAARTGPAPPDPAPAGGGRGVEPQPVNDFRASRFEGIETALKEVEAEVEALLVQRAGRDDARGAAQPAPPEALREDKLSVQDQSAMQQDGMVPRPDDPVSHQVSREIRLFENGLPCNLSALINGLIILEKPIGLRQTVSGDTLLHAAARKDSALLVQTLLEAGADPAALNADGLTAAGCAGDPAVRALLHAPAAR